MTASRRVGILGGMFDPVHNGHVDVLMAAQAALELAEIFVVPASIPPHRPPPAASSYHRFAMLALAIADRLGWQALDLELQDPMPSYTSKTLRQFQAQGFGATELFFLSGADAFLEITAWQDYPTLLDMAHFAVISRPGVPVGALPARFPSLAPRMHEPRDAGLPSGATLIFLIDAQTADVSSTAIRRRRAQHQSIAGLVPPLVQQHIERHRLYQDAMAAVEAGLAATGQPADGLHGRR